MPYSEPTDLAIVACPGGEAFANEVLDDVANQLAALIHELKQEKNSFEQMGIDYEEKAFYDIFS